MIPTTAAPDDLIVSLRGSGVDSEHRVAWADNEWVVASVAPSATLLGGHEYELRLSAETPSYEVVVLKTGKLYGIGKFDPATYFAEGWAENTSGTAETGKDWVETEGIWGASIGPGYYGLQFYLRSW